MINNILESPVIKSVQQKEKEAEIWGTGRKVSHITALERELAIRQYHQNLVHSMKSFENPNYKRILRSFKHWFQLA